MKTAAVICLIHLSCAASYHLDEPITADFPDSEKARAVSCPDSWTPTLYQTCLKYMDQSKSWDDAKDSCENLNAELVTFSNKLHILFFKGFLADIDELGSGAWIGAHKHFGDWQFDGIAKGLMGTITDWKSGEPNWESQKCVSTSTNGKWNNLDCDWRRKYVCEMRGI